MRYKQGNLIIGSLIITLLLLVGGVYSYLNKKDLKRSDVDINKSATSSGNQTVSETPIDNLKKFKSDKYGFEFEYPEKYKISGLSFEGFVIEGGIYVSDDNGGGITIFPPTTNEDPGGKHINPKATSLEDYEKDYKDGNNIEVSIHGQEKLVINGFPALKQRIYAPEFIDGYTETTRYVIFDGKNKFIILKGNESILNTVLSTFKFD